MTGAEVVTPSRSGVRDHAMARFVVRRLLYGVITLFVVSVIVFAATQVLPGNAAYAVLGHSATPERLASLERQLHLDHNMATQYWDWLSNIARGRLGTSLANGQAVSAQIEPRLANSAALVVLAGSIGTLVGVAMGAVAALRKDGPFDHAMSLAMLVVTSVPEFVVAIALIAALATNVFHWLPGVSFVPPGSTAWAEPRLLILPVATLVLVVMPYMFRMMRAATIEALESDYVEMAHLKGLSPTRILFVHALPNAIAPTIQVVGLTFLYLAGGIVVVEDVFNFPGIGQGLVSAVSDRDIPMIQAIVVLLAAFYFLINLLTDVVALAVSPRRRNARAS